MKFRLGILSFLVGLLLFDVDCSGQLPTHCSNEDNWHSLENNETARRNCGPAFENRCICERICYESKHQYVVNCTNTGFTNQTILTQLPEKTEVLIMTGNHFSSLEWNIFGEEDLLPHLRVIDFSNNGIQEIHGKAFHHVKNVETLILDFNNLSMMEEKNHFRVFSNFVSLKELHLTDAFEDTLDKQLDEILYKIFINSNLNKLIKIHLEQNEIKDFHNQPSMFCKLPNLFDIYLGDNLLDSLEFDLNCLPNLRFVDLRRNRFKTVQFEDMRYLGSIIRAKHDNQVQVDFSENPFECSCALNPFIKWIETHKDSLRNNDMLTCRNPTHKFPVPFYEMNNCSIKAKPASWSHQSKSTGTTVLLCFLSLVLISLIFALIYVQRSQLKQKLDPVIETVHKRVRYTSIATADGQEISV